MLWYDDKEMKPANDNVVKSVTKSVLFGEGDKKSSQPQIQSYTVGGKALQCQVCSHDKFWQREAQLNTATATFFGFDWANKSAVCYVCDNCGYIHWFLPKK
jgi:predicted nucleic-acid-binding Zn-ribbon protein